MTSKSLETGFSRRTSQRHRLKMLRNLDEYKISNPYKAPKSMPSIPEQLSEQLKRVEYLSSTSISMLKMEKQNTRVSDYESVFIKMNQARRLQQEKYRQLFQLKEEQKKEELQMMDCDSISQDLHKEECLPQEVITTRQQISLDFESIHNNLFYKEHEDGLNLLQENLEESRQQHEGFKEHQITIMDVQYEHYFVN